MENLSETTESNNANTLLAPVIVENLNDAELLAIVDELQKEYFDNDSILRVLAKQYFGGDNLVQILGVANKILPIIAERMKCYSPHL